jgi:hypothetical protein
MSFLHKYLFHPSGGGHGETTNGTVKSDSPILSQEIQCQRSGNCRNSVQQRISISITHHPLLYLDDFSNECFRFWDDIWPHFETEFKTAPTCYPVGRHGIRAADSWLECTSTESREWTSTVCGHQSREIHYGCLKIGCVPFELIQQRDFGDSVTRLGLLAVTSFAKVAGMGPEGTQTRFGKF